MLKFLCIGAQKSATTWLYQQLSQCENVRFPGGKEVHYWNARYQHEPLEWYQGLFSPDPALIEGDITPAYATLDDTTVARVAQLYPELKIIFILRNPITRAWSSALMALKRAEMTPQEASDQWFIDHFNSRGSRTRGDYETTLRRWRHFFAEQHFLLLWYDDIQTTPHMVMQEVYGFLGLPAQTPDIKLLQQRVFAGSGDPLRPALEQELKRLYSDDIRDLGQYLQRDLSHWLNFNCLL